MSDEAERAEEHFDIMDEARRARELLRGRDTSRDAMRERYEAAKAAKTGSDIECPTCGTVHRKTMHAKVFCSNGRTKGGNCKDRYWNIIEPARLRRTQKYLNR